MEPADSPTPTPTEAPVSSRLFSAAPRFRWRLLFIALRVVALIWIGVTLVLAALQTQLIFPGAAYQGTAETRIPVSADRELLELATPTGEKIAAIHGAALNPTGESLSSDEAAKRPTLIYFYGNAMCVRSAIDQFNEFRKLGLNVLVPDYLGFGMSEGSPSELGCRATADATYEYLTKTRSVDPRHIIAAGWSLGGAVAIDLADRQPVEGLIVFCTFTRIADMVNRLIPFIPTSLVLTHKFDSLSKIPRITCPILIGHGRRDQIIPFEMSEKLANAARGPVTRFAIDNADHNDFFVLGDQKILSAMKAFVESLPQGH